MSYKKYILEKYIESQNTEEKASQKIERLKTMIDDIIEEKNRLEIHNSLIRYQNINLIKENQKLKDKLQDKLHNNINSNMMNWEILEEITFDNWVYNASNASNTSKKRKSLISVEKTFEELNNNSQQKKKQKRQIKKTIYKTNTFIHTPPSIHSPPIEKNVNIMYDSDETITDDELSFTKT